MAPESAAIGSIGAVFTISKRKVKEFKEGGISGDASIELISSSPNKVIYNAYGPDLSPEDRAKIQQEAMLMYEIFYTSVGRARGLSLEEHWIWGDAQIFNAQRALELGLIDKIGSYTHALEELLKLIEERMAVTGKPELIDC